MTYRAKQYIENNIDILEQDVVEFLLNAYTNDEFQEIFKILHDCDAITKEETEELLVAIINETLDAGVVRYKVPFDKFVEFLPDLLLDARRTYKIIDHTVRRRADIIVTQEEDGVYMEPKNI